MAAQLTSRRLLRINRSSKVVHLSRIFEWFAENFAAGGGALEFVRPYLSPADRVWLTSNGPRARIIEYFDYDWSLNGVSTPAARK